MGEWGATDGTVRAAFVPPAPGPGESGHAGRHAKAGRTIRLEIAPEKSCRLSPRAARRVAAELIAAADAAKAAGLDPDYPDRL